MAKLSNGRYGKFSKLNGIKVLAFIPEGTKHDSHHEVFKTLKEKFHLDVNCYQSAETREEMGDQHFDMSFWNVENNEGVRKINTYFEYVLISCFNIYGQRIYNYLVQFDFDNDKVNITTVNGNSKSFKVKDFNDYKYIMRTTKTMIKFRGGMKELYKETINQMHVDSAFNWNNLVYGMDCKYIEGVK